MKIIYEDKNTWWKLAGNRPKLIPPEHGISSREERDREKGDKV